MSKILCYLLSSIGIRCNEKKINELEKDIKLKDEEMTELKDSINTLNSKTVNLEENIIVLVEEKQKIQERYDLFGRILNAKSLHNKALKEFNKLCENDFMEFANDESSLAEEAEALLKLQSLQEKLHVMCNFPAIFNKTIVGIGGGFSSGKSAFLNSIITNKNIKLATGINPVTALPTYITSGFSDVIKIYSIFGGSVNIETSLYKEISHDFIKSLGFNLKDIVPFMAVETQIGNFDKLCFIDTPGYNPAQNIQTRRDFIISKEYLNKAKVLLWVIGVDANGTIPTSDLEILNDFMKSDKKLFIILSKADLKPKSDIDEIVEEIRDVLDDYDIQYEGISAYSSSNKEELTYDKKSLFDFLEQINRMSEVRKQTEKELEDIFEMYINALEKDLKKFEDIRSQFKTLELDLFQANFDTEKIIEKSDKGTNELSENFYGSIMRLFNKDSESVQDRIDSIRENFDTKILKDFIKRAEKLREKMLNSIEEIFISLQG